MEYGLSHAVPAIAESADTRMAFIRKVYLLTFTGILAYFGVTLGIGLGAAFGNGAAQSILGFMVGMNPLITLLLLIGASMAAHRMVHVKGLGIFAFYGFAAILGLLTSGLIFWALIKFEVAGGLLKVAQALGLTTLVFGALTAYVFISRKDFSFLRGFLFVGLMIGLVVVVAAIVAPMLGFATMSGLDMGISIFFALLFMGYILYDTSNVLHHYSTDMVVPAAMALWWISSCCSGTFSTFSWQGTDRFGGAGRACPAKPRCAVWNQVRRG